MTSILELWAYEADNTTFLGILDTAFAIQYQAELNATGAGRFRIPVVAETSTDPTDLIIVSASDTLAITAADSLGWTSAAAIEDKSDHVALGNIIRLRLDNTDVGAFIIEDINEDDLLTEHVIEASGRGLLALLDRAIVWPSSTSTYTTVQKTYLAKTMGYMIRDLRSEAVTRGVTLPTVDFTNTLDSSGAAFTDSSTISYRAGTTLLDIAEQHAGLGVEVWVTPAGVLQYFISKGSNLSASVFFREGQNAVRASRLQTARQLANAILGEGQYTLSVQTDATSIAAYGRRERLVQHGNVSDPTTLATLTQLSRDTWKNPQTMLDLRIDDSLVPFIDYTVGDTVAVDLTQAAVAASYRVRAINLEDNGAGLIVGVVLNSMIDERLERMERALRRRLMTPIDSENHGNSDPTVGGWALTPTYLVRDTGSAATSAGMAPDDYPFFAGQVYASRASAPFRVTPAGALTATNATITGSVTATTGAIGGWTIGASSFTGGNATIHSTGYLLLGTSNDIVRLDAADATYRLWIGHATAASAPFRVTKGGALTATSATITGTITATAGAIGGWTVGASSLTGGNATLHSSGYLLLGTTNDIARLDAADATYRLWIGNATAASAPFRVSKGGALTATSATITGTITATAGDIGGWTVGASSLTGGDATLHSSGYLLLGTVNNIVRIDAADATYRLWIGNATAASAPFRVSKGGALTATSATITGTITATAGDIGGWTINSTYLAKDTGTAATSAGLAPSDYPFYAGATYANRASAPFRVTPAGALTATAGAIGGWTLGATTLSGGDATLSSSGYLDLGTGNDIVRLDAANATYRLWIGNATAASAPFRITKAGYVTAISGSIGGFTLGGSTMYNGTFVLDAGNGRVTFNTGAYFSTGGGTVINATCSNLSSGGGITAADYLVVTSTSATNIIHGDTQIDAARIGYIGCYGTSPVATKQTVTGSRGGNAALASLLTALATYGIITNSSTA